MLLGSKINNAYQIYRCLFYSLICFRFDPPPHHLLSLISFLDTPDVLA
jgi:hypothetical protein